MTEHDVLVAAKSYLLNHGWMQGDYGDHNGPRCLVGALHSATPEEPITKVEQGAAHELLVRVVGLSHRAYLPEWNDEASFTDVIAALDEAILATAPAETSEPVKEAVPA